MIDTVIFDMDGLLIDSEPLWGQAMREVFASVGVELSMELAILQDCVRQRWLITGITTSNGRENRLNK